MAFEILPRVIIYLAEVMGKLFKFIFRKWYELVSGLFHYPIGDFTKPFSHIQFNIYEIGQLIISFLKPIRLEKVFIIRRIITHSKARWFEAINQQSPELIV